MIVSPGINLNDISSPLYILQLCILTCAYRVLHLRYIVLNESLSLLMAIE